MRTRTMLILGLAVREAFSFWTAHPFDFEIWVRAGHGVANGLSPYAPLPFVPGLSFANDFGGGSNPAIGYLPFWPLLLGGIFDLYSMVGGADRFVYYFMIKQPIIFADVAVAFLLFLYVRRSNPGLAPRVMALWLFSPFTIILSSMWGIFDSIAMAFLLLALLAPEGRGRAAWAGIAIFAKSIPVLFALPLSYARERKALNVAIAVGLPSVLTVLAVYLMGWPAIGQQYQYSVATTLENTLGSHGFPLSLWGTPLYLNYIGMLPNSTVEGIFNWGGYLWIPAVVVATLLAYRWFGFATERDVIRSMLLVMLTFLLVRAQVNEQYAVYLLAFLLIDAALWSPRRMRLFYAVSVVIIAATVTNNWLLIRFLAPVYPNALSLEASTVAATGQLRNTLLYLEGLTFCALNIYYLASLIRERRRRWLA